MNKITPILLLSLGLISGCATEIANKTYKSMSGNSVTTNTKIGVNSESFKNGTFRFDKARLHGFKTQFMYSDLHGIFVDGTYKYKKVENNKAELALGILMKSLTATDLTYFHLGWIAEELGYYDAAFTYFNLSKTLFFPGRAGLTRTEGVYDTSGEEISFKNLRTEIKANNSEIYSSYCGGSWKPEKQKFTWDATGSCPLNMIEYTRAAIKRLEPQPY